MNFIDAYEVPGTATPQVAAGDGQPQQSLNEEVSQVIGQLNRFWGGFRKQSQTAIEVARKDFGQVVEQAQKELSKFNSPVPAAESTSAEPADPPVTERSSLSEQTDETSSPSSSATETPPASESSTSPSTFTPQSLFTRLQSSLPPNLVSTVQAHIPPLDSLRHAASESVDFAQIRTTLTSEFQRVQGVTRAQAEEYVHKSEDLLREAVKEAGDFFKDAVKVVPPEGQDRDTSVGVVWDGSDVWMLPSSHPDPNLVGGSSVKGKENEDNQTSGEARRAVATRAEALLRRLRHDPEVVKADPEIDPAVKSLYDEWLKREVAENGGIQSPDWMERRKAALSLVGDEEALKILQESLVPSVMTEDVFWTRYFFRAYQIDREAERRKALLQAPSDSEDAFSWEDDDEEVASPTAATASSATGLNASSTKASSASIPQVASRTLSPGESSEESFDVVSNAEENLHKGIVNTHEQADGDEEDDNDEDEDEDEDEDDDEDEDEEGSGDSDWE